MSLTRLLALALLVAACGGSRAPAPAPADVDGACTLEPETAAGRVAAPPLPGDCDDEAVFGGWRASCDDARDPAACFQVGACLNVTAALTPATDPARAAAVDGAMAAFEVSCAGGIAEACAIAASLAEEEVRADPAHPRRDALLAAMCAGYQRACQLGEEVDGCVRCRVSGCTGLPGTTPAPFTTP